MKQLIEKVSQSTGVKPDDTKKVIEAVALELSNPETQTAFIQASKPLHRAHLEAQAAKNKPSEEVATEKKSAKKAPKGV